MTTAQDLIDEEMMFSKHPFNIDPNHNFFETFTALKTEKNESVIAKMVGFFATGYTDLSGLQCGFFHVKGFLDCAEKTFWISEDEYEIFTHLLLSCYLVKSLSLQHREKVAVEALNRLIERNINEFGSGAFAVKKVLLGLYNGSAYPFDLTSLRNLDSNNFDDVMAVLNSNARSCPPKEIHEYLKDGAKVWQELKRHVEPL